MAPKTPPNKKGTVTYNVRKGSNVKQALTPAINYSEAQTEEVDVLKAIFMGDYEDVEVKGAWSKTTDRSFKLKLRSFSDQDSYVTLSVKLTATYPKSPPVLDIAGLSTYRERTQERIRNVVQNRPKQMLGEVMIHAIASEIQEALEDAVQARQQGTLPSLEDERASAEEVATTLAREVEEAEARRQREAQAEEERMLKQMVDEEVNRREKRKPPKPMEDGASSQVFGAVDNAERIAFDQPSDLLIGNESIRFSAVNIVSREQDKLIASPNALTHFSPLVAVKRSVLRGKSRDELLELESVLEKVRILRHTNLLSLLAYRTDSIDTDTQVTLCTELASRGSLRDLLELSGVVNVDKGRQFTVQLLEGLEYCHRHGIAHGDISADTVVLTGRVAVPRFADVGYGRLLPSNKNDLPEKWRPPETADDQTGGTLRRSDIWQLGVVVLQMLLGLNTTNHQSPQVFFSKSNLSDAFEDFARKMLTTDARKRPSPFDLLPAEFLRTDAAVIGDSSTQSHNSTMPSVTDYRSPMKRRSRHNSSNVLEPVSRYANDFTEISRLGKGGFGEVVKARNKLDGGVYAVKKICQAPQLDQILSEVMLLNRLNHPYVVRYFSTWVEETSHGVQGEAGSTTEGTIEETAEDTTSASPRMDFDSQSIGGLDFVSSSGYPQVEFGDDESDEDPFDHGDPDGEQSKASHLDTGSAIESAENSGADGRIHLRKSRSDSRGMQTTLYIQMEYCERRTLRDLIRKNMTVDDSWRFFRQITEGLAHVHSHGIIHRDLKPDNIFIDIAGSPKIGDFGLATTSQYHSVDRAATMSSGTGGDMTRSVGTALYVAPELRSGSGISYNDKVDLYSLGIMFYEMCEPFGTAMERIRAIQQVREKVHELPSSYHANGEKAAQGKLISCLISHKPSERLSSAELLRSDILPLKLEDETLRQALSGLSDPKSPYHQKMLSALFAHDTAGTGRIKALAWGAKSNTAADDPERVRLRAVAKSTMEAVFKRHGAEESHREAILPRSGYYTSQNVVQLLDSSSNLLQLPYDLTLPYARQVARQIPSSRCTFTFGKVFRDVSAGGPPRASEEVDFDIISSSEQSDEAFDDAETLKVIDEVVCELPNSASSTMASLHLNHCSILNAVLDHCRVPTAQQPGVKECISKLGFHQWTWAKIRAELRSPAYRLPNTVLDELQQFDFRDLPDKAYARLRVLLEGANARSLATIDSGVRHLKDVIRYISNFSIQRKVFVVPLASFNAKFYEGGMLFLCVQERKTNRDVIAAGGRYDSLIRAHRTSELRSSLGGAVGVSIGLDRLIANMARNAPGASKGTFLKEGQQAKTLEKRCNVLVIASGTDELHIAGTKLVASLWANNISAELSTVDRTTGEAGQHSFVVTMKHEASTTVRLRSTDIDIDEDITTTALVTHLLQELRDREGSKVRPPALPRQASHHDSHKKGNVQVLMSQHRSKKSNKYHIVEAAQQNWSEKLDEWKEAPILAIETRDDVLELLRETRLSDAETWRKAVQRVQLNERQYVQQVQGILGSWQKSWEEGDGTREACIFNFRTGQCIYYDLGA